MPNINDSAFCFLYVLKRNLPFQGKMRLELFPLSG